MSNDKGTDISCLTDFSSEKQEGSEAENLRRERGSVYGEFWENAPHALRIFEAVQSDGYFKETGDEDYDKCVKYFLFMVCTKLSRLAQSPTHRDSVLDIGGYAQCMVDTLDEWVRRGKL